MNPNQRIIDEHELKRLQEQAGGWEAVFEALLKGNPAFCQRPLPGRECALMEIARLYSLPPPAMPEHSKLGTHLSHCNFGEHAGSCKYGHDDCPALTDRWSWFGQQMQRMERFEKALEYIARHQSSDWPERAQEIVGRARMALRPDSAGTMLTRDQLVVAATAIGMRFPGEQSTPATTSDWQPPQPWDGVNKGAV